MSLVVFGDPAVLAQMDPDSTAAIGHRLEKALEAHDVFDADKRYRFGLFFAGWMRVLSDGEFLDTDAEGIVEVVEMTIAPRWPHLVNQLTALTLQAYGKAALAPIDNLEAIDLERD